MAKKQKHPEHENLERWLVSYSDFITLLFATFVVLYALSQVDISDFAKIEQSIQKAFTNSLLEGSESFFDNAGQSILEGNNPGDSVINPLMLEYLSPKYEEQAFEKIESEVKSMIEKGELTGVDATVTEPGLLITFKNDFLFLSGSATLTDSSVETLRKVGKLLFDKFKIHYIRVEGHTDNVPIVSFMFPSNWELSGSRATTIIRFLIDEYKFNPKLFTAVGYGDTRPIADNSTKAGRDKNRRVEILVLKNKFNSLEHTDPKEIQKIMELYSPKNKNKDNANNDGSAKFNTQSIESAIQMDENNTSKFKKEELKTRANSLSPSNKAIYEQTTENLQNGNNDEWLDTKFSGEEFNSFQD